MEQAPEQGFGLQIEQSAALRDGTTPTPAPNIAVSGITLRQLLEHQAAARSPLRPQHAGRQLLGLAEIGLERLGQLVGIQFDQACALGVLEPRPCFRW